MNIVTVFLLVIARASLYSCRTRHSVSLLHDPSSDIALVTPHKVPTLAQLIPILEGQDPPETKIRKLKKLLPIYDELNKWRIENNKRLVEILPFKKKVKPLAFILAGNDFVKVNKAEGNSVNDDIYRKKLKTNKKHKRKPHTQKNKHSSNVEHNKYSDSESESDSDDDSPESNDIEDGNTRVYKINLKPNSETHNELVRDSPKEVLESANEGLLSHRPYFASHSNTPTIKPHSIPVSDLVLQQFEPFTRESDVVSHKHTDTNDSESESNEISESGSSADGESDLISEHSSSEVETSKVNIELDKNADSDEPHALHDKTNKYVTDYNEKESYLKEEPEKSTSDAESNDSISDVNRKGSVESKETESDESEDSISDKTIESNSDMNSDNDEESNTIADESNQSVESNESKSALNKNESVSIPDAESEDSNLNDKNSNNSVSDVSNESVFDANSEPASDDIESNDESVFDVTSSIPDGSIDYSSLYDEDFLKSKSISDESLSDVSKSESISESNDSGSVFDTASVSKEVSDVENEVSVSNENSNEHLSRTGFIPNPIPKESILIPYADNDLELDMESIKSNEVYKSHLNWDSNEYESVYVESGESLDSKYDPELNENVQEVESSEIIEGHTKHIHVAPNANDGAHNVFIKGNHYYVADDFDDKTVDNIRRVVTSADDSELDSYNFDGHIVDNSRVASNDDASKLASEATGYHIHEHVHDDNLDIKSDQSSEIDHIDKHVSINQEDYIQVSRNEHNITDRDGDSEEKAALRHLEKNHHHHHNHQEHHHQHHNDTEPTPKPFVVKENSEEIEQLIPRLILEHQNHNVPIVYDDDKVEENEAPIFHVELTKHHNNDDGIPETPKVQYVVAEYIDDVTDLDSTSVVLEKDEDRVDTAPSRRVLLQKIYEMDDIIPNKQVVLVKEVADTENDFNDDVTIELDQAKEHVIEKPTHYRYKDIENKKYENNQPVTKGKDNLKDCDVTTPKVRRKQQKTYKLSFTFN